LIIEQVLKEWGERNIAAMNTEQLIECWKLMKEMDLNKKKQMVKELANRSFVCISQGGYCLVM